MLNITEGEILLVNKPYRWTSFDVIGSLRGLMKHLLGGKKIKVGHAGTLDPLATGLLIVGTGKATKRFECLALPRHRMIWKKRLMKLSRPRILHLK